MQDHGSPPPTGARIGVCAVNLGDRSNTRVRRRSDTAVGGGGRGQKTHQCERRTGVDGSSSGRGTNQAGRTMSIWRLFIVSGSSSGVSIISVVRVIRIDRSRIRRGGTIAGSATAPPGLCRRELATTTIAAVAVIAALRIPLARAPLRVL